MWVREFIMVEIEYFVNLDDKLYFKFKSVENLVVYFFLRVE